LFFHGANPSIKYGGMAMESKKEIYDLIPKNWIPKTIFISLEHHFKEILSQLKSQEIKFPVILKPDIGLKGLGVVEIKNLTELEYYQKRISICKRERQKYFERTGDGKSQKCFPNQSH
jgi:glutathione synthase/RimK-type ligase-like ATP-grasp enzyme